MCVASPTMTMALTTAQAVGGYMSSRAEARAYEEAGQRDATQLEQQKQQAKLQAEQEETARMEEFQQTMGSNIAFRAILGRDPSDPSFRAFEENNYRTYKEDLNRIALQSNITTRNIDLQKQYTLEEAQDRASSARRSGLINFSSTMRGGIMDYQSIKVNKVS